MREEIIIRENGSKRVIYHFDDPSLTRQEFKDECDLEKILRKFSGTPEGLAMLSNVQGYVSGRFEDVSSVPDYRTSLDMIRRADEAFNSLPADIRTKFDNDAAKFLDFVDNPENEAELRSLGLLKPKVESPVKPADAGGSTPPVKG